MANEKFGPHLPMILKGKDINEIYELWGVDYGVSISLPASGETPESMRHGYCRAYMSHFKDSGLSFPLPLFILEALAKEEGLKFDLEELKQLCIIKKNQGFPGTMLLSPHPGRNIVDDFFGSAPMSPELRGMIEVLCRGRPRWLAFNAERIRAAYARPPGQNHAAHIGYGANRPSIYVRVYVIFIVKLLM
ncbi:hypothetical protein DY000_02009989 [Brassica cretica]|uniref:Uncharacterized protein n=1 Tax=Brassica cretica TaxID=69181 RepID=A0ABQ7CJF7_BRACR|nr:hypothetical protein DY000_02009989 [Brassica cretica]